MQRDHLTRRHCSRASLLAADQQQHGSQRPTHTHDALAFPPGACPDRRGVWRRRCSGFTLGRDRDARGNLRVLGLVRAHTERPVLMTNLLIKASSGNVTDCRRTVMHFYSRELEMHAEERTYMDNISWWFYSWRIIHFNDTILPAPVHHVRNDYIISVEKSIRLSLHENKIMQTFSDTFLWTWTFWRACDGLLPCYNHFKTICFQFHS